ncbi:uncharacterized protein LOC126569490 [Anopheles aquasalis]|uniref:uncharacterized protein LOC126569490 n=1 Tax=Anopheles aquasalis TaxID=42839 RepID=UPI00215A4DB4|nr:uncharacterized protein LOC126569490 [Anopheles aquasalis]
MGIGSSSVVKRVNNQLPVPCERHIDNAVMTNGEVPQCTEMFSRVVTSCTVPVSEALSGYCTGSGHHWQSQQLMLSDASMRQPRSRHRSSFVDSRLHNSYVDAAAQTANTRISDIRRVEENLRMESLMLSLNQNIPMPRCSSPSPAYCFHCDHDHRERCCLYVGDKPEDGPYYSRWKRDLENPTVRPQYIAKIPEAVSGNSTPFWFPAFTYTKPEDIKQKMMEKHPPVPQVWMRQYYYPIVGYGHEHQLLNQATLNPPTPYQQYLQQHQQEVYRLYYQPHQQQLPGHGLNLACSHGTHECKAGGVISPGSLCGPAQYRIPQHVPMSGDEYVQQGSPTPCHYYPTSYYYAVQQQPPQQHYLPMVYPTVSHVPPGYMHPGHSHHYAPSANYPATALPQREPTPPIQATSTPLWLLFCQKLSRKFPDRCKKSSPSKASRSTGKNYHPARHNPTTVNHQLLPTSTMSDHLPPKYSNIDHHLHHLQYSASIQQPHYPSPVVVPGPHPTFYSHVPPQGMNDMGMYYVTPAPV